MAEALITAAPACARLMWCDHSSLYLEIPHISGGPPFIMKLPLSSSGLSSALELLKDARNATLPKGGSYSFAQHPATKQVGVSNKVAHDILKKMRMI